MIDKTKEEKFKIDIDVSIKSLPVLLWNTHTHKSPDH